MAVIFIIMVGLLISAEVGYETWFALSHPTLFDGLGKLNWIISSTMVWAGQLVGFWFIYNLWVRKR